MVFEPKSYNLPRPTLHMSSQVLKHADNIGHLGFTFSFGQKYDKDILQQLKMVCKKSNSYSIIALVYLCKDCIIQLQCTQYVYCF